MQRLKLTIELVPKTSWYDNLRQAMPQAEWNKLREDVYGAYDHRCGLCGAGGRLNCHEVWEYDDEHHIQRLEGFIALCPLCHFVKHIGLAGVLASRGRLNFDDVVQHFLRVNDCDRETFEAHRQAAFDKWRERSQYLWDVDLGAYEDLVN